MLKKIKNKNPLNIISRILILTFSFLYLSNFLRNNSIYFMPKEYKTIKKIVDKIASKNNLGDRDIPLSALEAEDKVSQLSEEAEALISHHGESRVYVEKMSQEEIITMLHRRTLWATTLCFLPLWQSPRLL